MAGLLFPLVQHKALKFGSGRIIWRSHTHSDPTFLTTSFQTSTGLSAQLICTPHLGLVALPTKHIDTQHAEGTTSDNGAAWRETKRVRDLQRQEPDTSEAETCSKDAPWLETQSLKELAMRRPQGCHLLDTYARQLPHRRGFSSTFLHDF